MWKSIFLVIIVFVLAAYSASVKDKASRNQQAEPTQIPVQPVSPLPDNKGKAQKQREGGYAKWGWLDILTTWPEGPSTIALILTLGAIVWQSDETRKAAGAALKQVHHTVAAERAWMLVTMDDPILSADDEAFTFSTIPKVVNKGQTVGFVLKWGTRSLFLARTSCFRAIHRHVSKVMCFAGTAEA